MKSSADRKLYLTVRGWPASIPMAGTRIAYSDHCIFKGNAISKFADRVQQDLIRAIDQDELVLPTLPEVALQVCEVAGNLDVSIQALNKVIGNDVALIARIIRVANSPLLCSLKGITGLQMVISRLGINYTYNLATGPATEQMFQATTDMIDRRIREVWNKSTEIVGICHVLARHYTHLTPDQTTLAGLVHQIGVLLIFTYAKDHNELLLGSISLSYVIERVHPLIGERILKAWDLLVPIAEIPRQHLNFTRNLPCADYTDLVQVATLQSCLGDEHPYIRLDWSQVPAFAKFGLEPAVDMKEDEGLPSTLEAAVSMLQQARPIPPGSVSVPASRPVRPG